MLKITSENLMSKAAFLSGFADIIDRKNEKTDNVEYHNP